MLTESVICIGKDICVLFPVFCYCRKGLSSSEAIDTRVRGLTAHIVVAQLDQMAHTVYTCNMMSPSRHPPGLCHASCHTPHHAWDACFSPHPQDTMKKRWRQAGKGHWHTPSDWRRRDQCWTLSTVWLAASFDKLYVHSHTGRDCPL